MLVYDPIMDAAQYAETHQRLTKLWHAQQPGGVAAGLIAHVTENHWRTFLIWHEEDLHRQDDLPVEGLREARRTVDRRNQLRNDGIGAGATLLALPRPDAPGHSECPGMMPDRLSILVLRDYHLEEEALGTGGAPKLDS